MSRKNIIEKLYLIVFIYILTLLFYLGIWHRYTFYWIQKNHYIVLNDL